MDCCKGPHRSPHSWLLYKVNYVSYMEIQVTENIAASEDTERLISIKTLATILEISTRTIWRLRNEGKLPEPIRLGGVCRWRLAEINQWIAAKCPDSQSLKERSNGRNTDCSQGSSTSSWSQTNRNLANYTSQNWIWNEHTYAGRSVSPKMPSVRSTRHTQIVFADILHGFRILTFNFLIS